MRALPSFPIAIGIDGVLVAGGGGRGVFHPPLGGVDGLPYGAPVLYATDVVLGVVRGGARLYGLAQLSPGCIIEYFNGIGTKGKQFWQIQVAVLHRHVFVFSLGASLPILCKSPWHQFLQNTISSSKC
jgi:hypothetical protein